MSIKRITLVLFFYFFVFQLSAQQNDSCVNASIINITNSGYGIGTFYSDTVDITNATIETGENFIPSIFVASQHSKSVWFRFSLPTSRYVRLELVQYGTSIPAGDVGFSIYKTNSCLPQISDVSTKLTPHPNFDSTSHPCVESGDYLVQVSTKPNTTGRIFIRLVIDYNTSSRFDHTSEPYDFGTLYNGVENIAYSIDCQSIDDPNELCSSISNATDFNKSTWHVFTTPSHFDYLILLLSHQNGFNAPVGIKIYQGDVRSTPYNTLPVYQGCDSIELYSYYPFYRTFTCDELPPNTTYSIQLIFAEDFYDNINLGFVTGIGNPTQAPEPIAAAMPASNTLGVLPSNSSGVTTSVTDYFSCNARHILHPCSSALPAEGIYHNGYYYNLSTFFSFNISNASIFNISAGGYIWGSLFMRLFKTSPGIDCSNLDSTNLVAEFDNSYGVNCFDTGNYVLQVMGVDTNYFNQWGINYYSYGYYNNSGWYAHLGTGFNINFTVRDTRNFNLFSLNHPGAFDSINASGNQLQPLVPGVTYSTQNDTLGCAQTVLPAGGTQCESGNDRAIYREFNVADSSCVSVFQNAYVWNRLFIGNADSLATAQNIFAFPDTISGLLPVTDCLIGNYYCDGIRTCITPGTYTLATFGNGSMVGNVYNSNIKIDTARTIHDSPQHVEDLGDIISQLPATGGTVSSTTDRFSCRDNAIDINGFVPCNISGIPATKAIYRQFYLSTPATISISDYQYANCNYWGYANRGNLTLFNGRISDSVGGLSPVNGWTCFTNSGTGACNTLPAGWYTVVSYGSGPTFGNPLQNINQDGYGSYLLTYDYISINISIDCEGQKYNRPYKAAIDTTTHQPFLIQWGPNTGHTAAYPNTYQIYDLPTEHFNCIIDTPFATNPILPCFGNANRVAYYVFKTTQESYLDISSINSYYYASLFKLDIRTDSALFNTATPIQPCISTNGGIQICRLEPGTYTLVIYAGDESVCNSVTPRIYIDQVGYSRFDHAKKAYDFGVVPPDNLYHSGKVGDVNPLDANRAPSNDFFYCTTGSQQSDPAEATCGQEYLSTIYNPGVNNNLYDFSTYTNTYNIPRRNLWYTFVVREGGYVNVSVQNKTDSKPYQYRFAVYKSDVNGNIPFTSVVSSGQIDSTSAQGLSLVAYNYLWWWWDCSTASSDISFYRDPCTAVTERYYVVVDNSNSSYRELPLGMQPNSQVEVSVKVDSINPIQPRFDHYYQASNIGSNLSPGTYTGQTDNYTCASRDANDPIQYYGYCSNKTLWYKFSVNLTGHVYYKITVNGVDYSDGSQVQLFRQVIPGDSTSNGLLYVGGNPACVYSGTYYLVITGCDRVNEYVTPFIQITEDLGDFCSAPVTVPVSGVGSSVASVIVDCHTIGTDYGEFNSTLSCPPGANTQDYKSSWFKIQITGTDTLDVTTFLSNNTNTSSNQIKYRLMNGDCNAMQEQPCVQDAETHDTYNCFPPGNYYVQVFTPVNYYGHQVTGSIDLHVISSLHSDTCAPVNNCLANANFLTDFNCNVSDSVSFLNFSTYGSNIQYLWDFGYGGQTSTSVTPKFAYPASASTQTYNVKLVVKNNGCSRKDSTIVSVVIPGRPALNLGPDRVSCSGSSVTLNASSWTGSTYLWQDGSTTPTYSASIPGTNSYQVEVNYNGCVKRDTVNVSVNPISHNNNTFTVCSGDSLLLDSYRGYGETYLWNTGATTSSIFGFSPGIYVDRLKWNNCYIRDTFKLILPGSPFSHQDTTVCSPFTSFIIDATMPNAQYYTWSNGNTGPLFSVPSTGLYWVDLNYGNCSKRDSIRVLAYPNATTNNHIVTACSGQPYLLPWGQSVSYSGVYADTIRNIIGCDSLYNRFVMFVQSPLIQFSRDTFCTGIPYILPWGAIVSAPGFYSDTLHYTTGCDSIRRTVQLFEQTYQTRETYDTICVGQTYTLPWGVVVNASGVYRDTLHYTTGCDSVRRIIHLTLQQFTIQNTYPTICSGQTYTLPWGAVVNTTGVYHDTLHYVTGCDSVRRNVSLTVQNYTQQNFSGTFCTGSNYTLPWGVVVNATGVYHDTLHYTTGCDSVRRTVTVTEQTYQTRETYDTICVGQTYTLPWGVVVNASGVYRDTLHYTTGCDSVRRTVYLKVQSYSVSVKYDTICTGHIYLLPWGVYTNLSGTYMDTLHYHTGCDSLRRYVFLTVLPPKYENSYVSICDNETYHLPWGLNVNQAGVYIDTVVTPTGCDSVVRTFNLSVRPSPQLTISKSNDINCTIGVSRLLVSGANSYQWTPSSSLNNASIPNPVATPQSTTLYHVQATGVNGCFSNDSIRVVVLFDNPENAYPVPSVFTPNRDGVNDCFGVSYWGKVSDFSFSIYNRWSEKVFFTTDVNKCWNGKYKGMDAEMGAYVYVIEAKGSCGRIHRKGTVVLVR